MLEKASTSEGQADTSSRSRSLLDADQAPLDRLIKIFLETPRVRSFIMRPQEILAAVMLSENLYASEAVQIRVPALHYGRFVLVGDAGYAAGPVGTGTSMAITGAYILAGEINDHLEDLDAGLRKYEEKMCPIIQDMQRIPPGFPGIMTPQSTWALRLRNLVLRTGTEKEETVI